MIKALIGLVVTSTIVYIFWQTFVKNRADRRKERRDGNGNNN